MKKKMLTFGVAVLSIAGVFAFKPASQTSITGKVTPAEGAQTVWAISGTDSSKAAINAGSFTFDVKPGIYTVVVDANEPYKDVTLENLEVKEDKPVDVGEIVLQQ